MDNGRYFHLRISKRLLLWSLVALVLLIVASYVLAGGVGGSGGLEVGPIQK